MAESLVQIAENLSLPALEAASQRLAWVGTSGGGKTYGAGRMVEQLSAANVPVLILDTVGVWPAVRLAADGKTPGLPFVIVGGDHADVPLDPSAGAKLAAFLVGENASAVVDLSDYAPDERAPFVADLCEALLPRLKQSRRPRTLLLDEAEDLAPEKPLRGEARMLRAVSEYVRKARNHGGGTILLTKRPQDVSKAVFNLCGNLFVGALFAAHERKAVREWAGSKARSEVVEEQLRLLPELQPGEFFFWSPSWRRIYERIRVLPKWTYDGSHAPLSHASLEQLAPVDVKALRTLLAPELLAGKADGGAAPSASVLPAEAVRGYEKRIDDLESDLEQAGRDYDVLQRRFEELRSACRTVAGLLRSYDELEARSAPTPVAQPPLDIPETNGKVTVVYGSSSEPPRVVREWASVTPARPEGHIPGTRPERLPTESWEANSAGPVRKRKAAPVPSSNGQSAGSTERYRAEVLATVCRYGPLSRQRLALLSGKSRTSTTFAAAIRWLVAAKLLTDEAGVLKATTEGHRQDRTEPLPTGRALFEHYMQKLSPYDQATFEALAKHRLGMTREQLANYTDHSRTSTTFAASIRTLKGMGLAGEAGGKVLLLPDVRASMGLD